jgi:hypothetical protein
MADGDGKTKVWEMLGFDDPPNNPHPHPHARPRHQSTYSRSRSSSRSRSRSSSRPGSRGSSSRSRSLRSQPSTVPSLDRSTTYTPDGLTASSLPLRMRTFSIIPDDLLNPWGPSSGAGSHEVVLVPAAEPGEPTSEYRPTERTERTQQLSPELTRPAPAQTWEKVRSVVAATGYPPRYRMSSLGRSSRQRSHSHSTHSRSRSRSSVHIHGPPPIIQIPSEHGSSKETALRPTTSPVPRPASPVVIDFAYERGRSSSPTPTRKDAHPPVPPKPVLLREGSPQPSGGILGPKSPITDSSDRMPDLGLPMAEHPGSTGLSGNGSGGWGSEQDQI